MRFAARQRRGHPVRPQRDPLQRGPVRHHGENDVGARGKLTGRSSLRGAAPHESLGLLYRAVPHHQRKPLLKEPLGHGLKPTVGFMAAP